jgi:hypothetical protein
VKLALPNSVSSLQDVSTLSVEIKEYSKWWAHNAIKIRAGAKKGTPPPALSDGAMELVRNVSGKKLLDQKMLDTIIAGLEEYKRGAHTATITLAAPAPRSVKLALVTWCRENIDPGILVSFEFNSTLLGGMVVRYGSHVFDWSFRRQILASRATFPEVLRRV